MGYEEEGDNEYIQGYKERKICEISQQVWTPTEKCVRLDGLFRGPYGQATRGQWNRHSIGLMIFLKKDTAKIAVGH